MEDKDTAKKYFVNPDTIQYNNEDIININPLGNRLHL